MGVTSWEKLLAVLPSLEQIQSATAEEIAAVEGFAEKTSEQVVASLTMKSHLIADLLKVGVLPYYERSSGGQGALSDKQIAITGKLSRPREEFEKLIKQAGGKVASAVSKTTYAVVTDDPTSNSSKMVKARALGVLVWSEQDLLQVLGL